MKTFKNFWVPLLLFMLEVLFAVVTRAWVSLSVLLMIGLLVGNNP